MKKIYAISLGLIFLSIITQQTFSQTAPGIEWQNTIGGSEQDNLQSMSLTTDGGCILGGHSNSNISGDKTENSIGGYDYWIVKLDLAGNIQWQNTIGGSEWDLLKSINETTDGGYICAGSSESNISGDKTENSIGNNDYWIIKLDASGNIQWQNTIGGIADDFPCSIQQTNDGGYIIGGVSTSNVSGDKTENSQGGYDYWIVKIDSLGNIQWQIQSGGIEMIYLIPCGKQMMEGIFLVDILIQTSQVIKQKETKIKLC